MLHFARPRMTPFSRKANNVSFPTVNSIGSDDPLNVFQLLARAGVPFVIIGGHAVNFHGHLRATEDADLIYDNLRFVSLRWLRKLKQAAGRHKDLDDLEHLPSS